MAISDSAKGIYLFGGSSAASIVPVAGTVGASLTYHAGTGDVWNSNSVVLGTGGFFTTPFNSVPRNRTILIVGNLPVIEMVFDNDSVLRWPPTVAKSAAMRVASGDQLVSWPAGGIFYLNGANPFFRAASGAPDLQGGPYDKWVEVVAYQDATYSFYPQIFMLGHGPTVADLYLGFTYGRNAPWFTSGTAYTGSALASQPTRFGHVLNGAAATTATAHTPLVAYAEYPSLSKSDALLAATDLVTRLEARGWSGIFHNPVVSE